MTPVTPILPAGLLALAFALPLAAQDMPVTTDAPACDARFTLLDSNGDGFLSEDEAPQVFARSRIDGFAIAADGYTMDEYIAACDTKMFDRALPEEGAPFDGANSFTEEQARDRAVAWGYTNVSPLTQDDQGIWRGGANDGETPVSIAIDYKGNVVATAP